MKKKYIAPVSTAFEINTTGIIATSPAPQTDYVGGGGGASEAGNPAPESSSRRGWDDYENY